MNKSLQKAKNMAENTKVISLPQLIEQNMAKMIRVAPRHIDGTRFTAMALSLIKRNPVLYKCDPMTILGSFFQCLELGLEPLDGQAYILPFKNKGRLEAQLIVGYKGLAQLFYRNENSISLEWGIVYQNDMFDYEKGTSSYLKHKKAEGDRGEIKGYYVIAKLDKAGAIFDYMSHEECMEHGRKYSKTWDREKKSFSHYSPWYTSPESMCLKTVLRNIMKLLPKSIEMQKVLEADERIIKYNPERPANSLLEMPDIADWNDMQALDIPQNTPESSQKPPSEQRSPSGKGVDTKNQENGAFVPSSSDLKNTPEETLRDEIGTMLLDLADGDASGCPDLLFKFTSFENKEGELVGGRELLSEVNGTPKEPGKRCQLEICHQKVKKAWREMFPGYHDNANSEVIDVNNE